jgi:Thiol:disulfide interchange protein DsbD, N-terminal
MRFVAGCLCLSLLPGVSPAEGARAAVVKVQAFLATNAAHPNSDVKVAVVAQIVPGYHINDHKPSLDYLIPTQLNFEKLSSFKVVKAVYPRGTPRKFAFLDSPISVYEGETRFGAILRVGRSLRLGTYKLRGTFAYQACTDRACLPPQKVPFEITVRVVPSSVPVKSANAELFDKIRFQ